MKSTTTVDPDEVFQAIMSTAKHRIKRQNLTIIHTVCARLKAKGNSDFSLTVVSRDVETAGGPIAKTMWNTTSADYRKLIEAWQAFAGAPLLRETHKRGADNPWLDSINDPAVRIIVEKTIAERNALRSEVNILKSQTNMVIDRRPITTDAIEKNSGDNMTLEILESPCLNEAERQALAYSISQELWEAEGWMEEKNGRVVKVISEGRVRGLMKPGFVTAIKKILRTE